MKLTPQRITLTNFRSYFGKHRIEPKVGPNYILSQNHDPMHDSNGGGKSTLVHAISWCLYGIIREKTKISVDVINYEATEVCVEVEFPGLTVKRYKKRGSAEVLSYSGPLAHIEAGVSEDIKPTQERLDRILGMDSALYFNALWLSNANTHFFRRTPGERQDILVDLIGGERIREARKNVEKAIKDLNLDLDRKRRELAGEQQEAKNAQTRIEDLLVAQEEEANRVEIARKQEQERLEAEARRIADLDEQLEGLEFELSRVEVEEQRCRAALPPSPQVAWGNVKTAEGRLAEARKRATALGSNIQVGGKCPTCSRPFEADSVHHAREAFEEASQEVQKLQRRVASERLNADEIQGRWSQLDTLLERKQAVNGRLESTRVLMKALLGAPPAPTAKSTSSMGRLQELLKKAQAELAKREARISEIQAGIELLELRLPKLQFWLTGFSGRGIQNLLLDDIRSLIRGFSVQYLAKLSGGILGIELPPSDKDFEIKMLYRGRMVSVDNLSDGELGRNGLAFLLALRRSLLYLNRCNLDFMVIDDAFGHLDATGQELTIEVANTLAEEIGTIFVTIPSDHPSIKPGQRILVSKKEGRTTVV